MNEERRSAIRLAERVARKWGYSLKIDEFTWRNPKGLTVKFEPFEDFSHLRVWLNYDASIKQEEQKHDFVMREK